MSDFNDRENGTPEGSEPQQNNQDRQWEEGPGFLFSGDKPPETPPADSPSKEESPVPHQQEGSDTQKPSTPVGGWSTRPPMGGQQPPRYGSYGSQQGNWNGQQPPIGGYGYGPQPGQQPPDNYRWNLNDYENATGQGGKRVKPKKNKGGLVFAAILMTVAIIGVLSFAGYGVYNAINKNKEPSSSTPQSSISLPGADAPSISVKDKPEDGETSTSADGKLTTAQIFTKVSPSVVGIANYQGNNSFTPTSEGSGIIMTADGYIVTNAHVVEGAKGISVILNNGETYSARVVGADSKTDLAVLKIEAANLTAAEFGNSDQVEVGEDVVAIGNPGGMLLSSSMSKGIVSGLNRNVSSSAYSTPFIQTDAAINPGNSGGALVNMYGQIIGINSAKLVATDYEGIGFSIPINNALPILEDLVQYGRVTGRAELGLTGQMIDDTTARISGYPTGIGILSLKENSDLVKKGVAPGDIITRIDGTPITSFDQITTVVAAKRPGDSVRLGIYRRSNNGGAGRTFDVDVVLIEDDGTAATVE